MAKGIAHMIRHRPTSAFILCVSRIQVVTRLQLIAAALGETDIKWLNEDIIPHLISGKMNFGITSRLSEFQITLADESTFEEFVRSAIGYNCTDDSDSTDVSDVTDITDVTDGTDIADVTDSTDVSDITDGTDSTDVTDFTDGIIPLIIPLIIPVTIQGIIPGIITDSEPSTYVQDEISDERKAILMQHLDMKDTLNRDNAAFLREIKSLYQTLNIPAEREFLATGIKTILSERNK